MERGRGMGGGEGFFFSERGGRRVLFCFLMVFSFFPVSFCFFGEGVVLVFLGREG